MPSVLDQYLASGLWYSSNRESGLCAPLVENGDDLDLDRLDLPNPKLNGLSDD